MKLLLKNDGGDYGGRPHTSQKIMDTQVSDLDGIIDGFSRIGNGHELIL